MIIGIGGCSNLGKSGLAEQIKNFFIPDKRVKQILARELQNYLPFVK